MSQRRCAIYTRKSTEEGLDQEFNSLHAQREACEAYIKSQAHEGWRLVRTAYDDGGFSGGSMERPALARLLADIQTGKIDVIVVYKVDRLTRSLSDFARIVETLDRQGTSFVSVTQQFNTTSSMGRLTLNVLLSFAQFEREVTGERIRDKIAASKAKGLWMGGMPPLGYDIQDRKLVINPAEAETVRLIFQRYVELGSVTALVDDLRNRQIKTKVWVPSNGISRGGESFGRLMLYGLLKNQLYIGRIAFKGNSYEGQHQAILPLELWDRAKAVLIGNHNNQSRPKTNASQQALTGLLFDDRGNSMSPTFARKSNGQRYNYYVSQPLLTGEPQQAGSVGRVPAHALEEVIETQLQKSLGESWGEQSPSDRLGRLRRTIERIEIQQEQIIIKLCNGITLPAAAPGSGKRKHGKREIVFPFLMRKQGKQVQIVLSDGELRKNARPDRTLIRAVARAHHWREILESGQVRSVLELARHVKHDPRYVRDVLKLAFLSPEITEAIPQGNQPQNLTLAKLIDKDVPLVWSLQQ